jgi:hypothetical protein
LLGRRKRIKVEEEAGPPSSSAPETIIIDADSDDDDDGDGDGKSKYDLFKIHV